MKAVKQNDPLNNLWAILDGDGQEIGRIAMPAGEDDHQMVIDAFSGIGETTEVEREFYASQARRQAYEVESDPVFFKWMRGEASKKDWLDKIADIRNRYS